LDRTDLLTQIWKAFLSLGLVDWIFRWRIIGMHNCSNFCCNWDA